MKYNFDTLLRRQTEDGYAGTALSKALERLPTVTPVGPWLAGGALRRTLLNESLDASDFDFFFAGDQQAADFEDYMKDIGAKIKFKNEKQTTWIVPATEGDGDKEWPQPALTVQAIMLRWYDSPEAIIDSFDFTLCQFVFDGETLTCGEYALWDLGRRMMVPHKITYGVASIRRIIKYAKQGFRICGGGIANILEQIVQTPDIVQAETKYID